MKLKSQVVDLLFQLQRLGFQTFNSISNFLIPLLLYKLSINEIGLENFGSIIFIISTSNFAWLFIDFNQTTTGIIDLKRKKQEVVINSIYTTRLAVFIFFMPFFLIIFQEKILYSFLIYITNFFKSINPNMLLIFKKKEKYLALVSIFPRAIIFSILYLKGSVDIIDLILYFVLSEGVISIYLNINNGIRAKNIFFSQEIIKSQIRRNFKSGTANFFTVIYYYVPVFLLKYFFDSKVVGIYSILEKIFKGISNLTSPINHILLSKNIFKTSLFKGFKNRLNLIFLSLLILLLIFFGVFQNEILSIITSDLILEYISQWTFLSTLFIPLIIYFSRLLLVNFYLSNQYDNKLLKIYFRTLILSIISFPPLIYFEGVFGAILGLIFTEVFCFANLFFIANKLKISSC